MTSGRVMSNDVSRPHNPTLLVNPRSGGGKAVRNDLVAHCLTRGIKSIVLQPNDDLRTLAEAAIRDGADAIGMAGGDGSQGTVAAIAAEHDVPFVCVPAGTRNHFALDLGLDVRNVVGALDAFFDGEERRIDLGGVNGRAFVNNVAIGVYAAVVQRPEYRDNKVRTTIRMMPSLISRDAPPFDLRFERADGRAERSALLLLISNNPYAIATRPRRGTRGRLDAGVLGIIAVSNRPPKLVEEWTATTFRVDSDKTVALGIDGESVAMEPPLKFDCLRQALTIRVPARP